MVKSRAAPPKWLFHVTWNGKDRYTLIEQSARHLLSVYSYSCQYSLGIYVHDITVK